MKTGIYDNIEINDYHDLRDYYNSTRIKLAKKSLNTLKSHDENWKDEGRKQHYDTGNAFEVMLTDKENIENRIAITNEEDWRNEALKDNPKLSEPSRSKVYRELKDKFYGDNESKYIITPPIQDDCLEMLKSCYSDDLIRSLVKESDSQKSILWHCANTGLKLKTRPDLIHHKSKTVIDIKTAEDGSPEKFSKACVNLDYPLQASLQIKGVLESGLLDEVKNYFWLVVEKNSPYNATLYRFTKDDQEMVADSIEYYIGQINEAVNSGIWGGYNQRADNKLGILDLELPLYYRR